MDRLGAQLLWSEPALNSRSFFTPNHCERIKRAAGAAVSAPKPPRLDRHDDHDRLAAVLDEARVPRLIRVRLALDGARLTVDLVREVLEEVGRGPAVLAGGAAQAVEHDLAVAGVDLDLALRLGRELRDGHAVAVLDRLAEVRLDDRAAVGQRRVGDRDLQRRRLQIALADGEVDAVAGRPRAVDPAALVQRGLALVAEAGLLAALLVLREALGRASCCRGPGPGSSPGRSMPVRRPKPSLPRPLLDRRALAVGLLAEAVEEHVRGDLQGVGDVDRAEPRGLRVLVLLRPELVVAVVVDRVAGLDQPRLERGQRRDRLERRADRIRGVGRAVEQRRAGRLRGQRLPELLVNGRATSLASKLGCEPMARIEPSVGSIAT